MIEAMLGILGASCTLMVVGAVYWYARYAQKYAERERDGRD